MCTRSSPPLVVLFAAVVSSCFHFLLLLPGNVSSFVPTHTTTRQSLAQQHFQQQQHCRQHQQLHTAAAALFEIPSWKDLAAVTQCDRHEQPVAVNGAAYSSHPENLGGSSSSNSRPILYRERHGWCPYSERVWIALETKGIEYDTIYIDNIYGRPNWYGGNTPQVKWEDGTVQSESMDLVREIDRRYDTTVSLYPQDIHDEVVNKSERVFRNIFPKKARPSSRAAFLFRYDGTPLWRNEFEKTLRETDALLGETKNEGSFFCGDRFTAADVCWAPFLERYAGQLPCLHEGLDPKCPDTYPHLHRWYRAMETKVPAYACRVRGDPSSWRKVLTMAGFGNAGALPPLVSERMEELKRQETKPLSADERADQQRLWDEYAVDRPYVAASPNTEAAAVLIRNRGNIRKDALKNYNDGDTITDLDEGMRSLAVLLCDEGSFSQERVDACRERCGESARSLAAFLNERMCVPRDMGALSASYFKRF